MSNSRMGRFALAFLLGSAATAALAGPALAESNPADSVEEVVVTGSLLRVPVSQQSQLVTTIGSEQLEQTGAASGIEALQTIAQNQTLINTGQSFGAGTGFATFANLRSLGSSNTLVLFNSRRLAVNPYQSLGVDLNTIPFNMIERVETLSDGASSIYGSDAIAGVINYITKRELTGLSVSATAFGTQHGGGERQSASIAGGVGSLQDDGWNIYLGYSYHHKRRLPTAKRDFADTGYIPERGFNRLQNRPFIADWNQPSVANNALQNPSAPACRPPESPYFNGVLGVNACAFDFGAVIEAFPEETDQSFLAHATGKLGEHHLVTLEYLRARTSVISRIAPFTVQNAPMKSTNVYFPGAGITPGAPGLNPANPVTINWRIPEAGLLTVKPVTDTDRFRVELEGDFAGFRYDAWALRSTSHLEYFLEDGWLDNTRLLAGIAGDNVGGAADINPFGSQSAAGAAFLQSIGVKGLAQTADTGLTSIGAQVSRDLFRLPAGPVQVAVSAEYKKETADFVTTPDAVRSTFAALLTTIHGDRESYGLVGEARIPIFEGFDADVSLRYDHYSDFGSTTNPKVLLTWKVLDALSLRASYNEGFRAPTLHNIFSPVNLADTRARFKDPVLCPGGVVNTGLGGDSTRDCGGVYRVRNAGNTDLGPETSRAYTVGAQIRPFSRLQIGIDYWRYHLQGTIAPLAESAIFNTYPQFSGFIVRCSQADPALIPSIPFCRVPHTGDPIAYVDQSPHNLGDTKTDGVDVTLRWNIAETDFGRFTFDYRGTWVHEFRYQLVPNGPFFDRAGVYLDGFPVINYSHYAALGWSRGAWSAQLSNRYLNGYTDCNAGCSVAPAFFNKVGAYSLWDLSATWDGPKGLTVIGRVTNLFDTDPPFTNRNQGIATGWDERFTDPVGRAFSLTVRYDF